MVVAAFSTAVRATAPAGLPSFDGLLEGLTVGSLQSRGLMEIVGLRRTGSDDGAGGTAESSLFRRRTSNWSRCRPTARCC